MEKKCNLGKRCARTPSIKAHKKSVRKVATNAHPTAANTPTAVNDILYLCAFSLYTLSVSHKSRHFSATVVSVYPTLSQV